MKIKKIIKKKYKLTKLKLIKAKVYKNYKTFDDITLEEIEHKLKKVLNILYLFHFYKKKILFICNPLYLNKQVKNMIKKNNHDIISELVWENGTLKDTSKNNILNIVLKIKKKNNVVVLLDKKLNNILLNEIYNYKIPIISFNNYFVNNNKYLYQIPGNFSFSSKTIRKNLFFSLLHGAFVKANKIKRRYNNRFLNINRKNAYRKSF